MKTWSEDNCASVENMQIQDLLHLDISRKGKDFDMGGTIGRPIVISQD